MERGVGGREREKAQRSKRGDAEWNPTYSGGAGGVSVHKGALLREMGRAQTIG